MGLTGTWHGADLLRGLERAVERGMQGAGKAMVSAAVSKIAAPAPPASRPGQPPHKRSGDLIDSHSHWITTEGGDIVLHVGVRAGSPAAGYAGYLIKGSPGGKIARRPWLDDKSIPRAGEPVIEGELRGALR